MKSVAITLRLLPDDITAAHLDDQSRKCNSLYNNLLETANDLKTEFIKSRDDIVGKTLYSRRGLRNLVPLLKNQYPYLKSVHSSVLKNTAIRLTQAITAHQRSRKKGNINYFRWPKFRSWKKSWFSLFYDEPKKGFELDDNTLRLTLGIGIDQHRKYLTMPIVHARLLKGQIIRNLIISKRNGTFFAHFTVLKKMPAQKPLTRVIALDPNHKNFVYGVDGKGRSLEVAAPHWLSAYDARFDELKAKLAHCKKKSKKIVFHNQEGDFIGEDWVPSRRYKNLLLIIDRLLAKRREQTKTFCYTIAHRLTQRYDFIAIGDYTPHGNGISRGMRRALNNRSLIGRFKNTLSWVTEKSGKFYEEYPESGTTRTCHACHFVMPHGIPLKVRTWQCPGCSLTHIRDENAACNGLRKILPRIQEIREAYASSVPSSGRVLIQERCAWKVTPRGIKQYRISATEGHASLPRN